MPVKILFCTSAADSASKLDVLRQHHDLTVSEGLISNDSLENVDLLIVDATLGEESIARQVEQIDERQKLRWLVVNQSGGPHEVLQYFQAGAAGVLGDKYVDETLLKCIETVRAGGVYIEAKMSQILAMRQIKKMLEPFITLSSREFDVFCLLAEGYPMAYIAENLGISTKTAFNCQTQLKKKMGLANQSQIRELAKKHGLI